MSKVGQQEWATQARIIRLFRDTLGYTYLGDWRDREENANIEEDPLRAFLQQQGYDKTITDKAIYELTRTAKDQTKSLYDINRAVYGLLRYGVSVQPDVGEQHQRVWLIDWEHPDKNHFAIAEEVTVRGQNDKRPDLVLYVNGLALGVLELKRSIVSVAEGIRQNLDSQKPMFIQPFFATMQLVMAGNDTEGLRYGTIETPEKYYLTWKEDGPTEGPLDRPLSQLCEKQRFLELLHDFIVFDAGVKKVCRHSQYFAMKAAQDHVRHREGGIIWHTQGSGKSLIMVWLAKWIRENVTDARVLIITDRTELDGQIETKFKDIGEQIYRTTSGQDLITTLNGSERWLICSLIHKFPGEEEGDVDSYVTEVKRSLPPGFRAKGDLYVFVDECHRTQSGTLHDAMKEVLPDAMFIGFTGTPLLTVDKKRSIEVFGPYIHTYKFPEAVADGVILDLRYEARDIGQTITSQESIDRWFAAKTKGLNDVALAQLKQKWGTMQKVLSSRSRLQQIVDDITLDMATKQRLMTDHGNALLVAGSIYEACKFYELFLSQGFDKCAIITSYRPTPASIKGEETGEGATEQLQQYAIYQQMLANWFKQDPSKAVTRSEEFEEDVKRKFVKEPGQIKLLVVVDMLLTGFDAPSATYLYIDKQMRDHGLFQAICRVNRLDGDDKEYGYIIDYKDLFKCLEKSFHDYTSEVLDGYDKEDVAGLLSDRLEGARERLDDALESVRAICEPVDSPKDTAAYLRYFCPQDATDADLLLEKERKRVEFYKLTAALIRAFADLANELPEAGYSPAQIEQLHQEVDHFEKARTEVRMASGDYIDLKVFEPAMRQMIDMYVRAEGSEKISAFDDMSLVQLLVERGVDAVDELPSGIASSPEATAETIESNLRKVIIDEHPVNPKYYDKMSALLEALILERRRQAVEYAQYLAQLVDVAKQLHHPASYPRSLDTRAKRALYDNLGSDEHLAVVLDEEIRQTKKDDWRGNTFKEREVRNVIRRHIADEEHVHRIFDLVWHQAEY